MSDTLEGTSPVRLLTIRDLVIEGFNGEVWREIVKGVSYHVDRGEVLGLIGESGAGKSTIGISAMGYARAGCRIAGGTIEFDGVQLIGAGREMLRRLRGRRIAYVAQSAAASFNPAHRIFDQIAETAVQEGILTAREARKTAIDIFRKLQLPEPEKIGFRYPHQVSGGQLQRCMVGMAMACKPDLIIFDEPTTALDVTTQIEVLRTIKTVVNDSDMAGIYITHDLAVVAQVADRIMVLRHGKEVETNETDALLNHPRQAYTRELLAVRKTRGTTVDHRAEGNLLEIDHVTAAYGNGLVVLDDVTTSLKAGQTVAVVGESGSGKSTLAKVITGLLPPAKGSVRFDGRELPPSMPGRSKDLLRRVQMIYQMADTALNPKHRIRKVIGRPLQFYFGLKGAALEKAILELLEMIELKPEYIDRLPGELSGGEKQRVCIARALAARPDVIICDEITSALDQLVAKGILELLQRLQNELAVSYLFITHDLDTVKAISDRIVVMHKGRVVEQGGKDEIFSPPHEPYTELLLSSVPEMDSTWLTRRTNRSDPKESLL